MEYSLEVDGTIDIKDMEKTKNINEYENNILWEEFEIFRKERIERINKEIETKKDEIEKLEQRRILTEEVENPYKKHRLKESTRIAVLKRDHYKCRNCGSELYLEVHHIVYRSNGGSDSKSNLITLCDVCHAKKHEGEPIYNLMMKKVISRR